MLAITRGLATELQPSVQGGVASVEFELPGAPHMPPPDEVEKPKERSLLSLFASGAAAIREFLAWHWPMADWTEEE